MSEKATKFESQEFTEKFQSAIEEYNKSIDSDKEPAEAAKEFMSNIFESNTDNAFEYQSVLENMEDKTTARKLQDIVFNSEVKV